MTCKDQALHKARRPGIRSLGRADAGADADRIGQSNQECLLISCCRVVFLLILFIPYDPYGHGRFETQRVDTSLYFVPWRVVSI